MAYSNANLIVKQFGCAGVPVTTQFVSPGMAATSATEPVDILGVAAQLIAVRVFCRVAPGGGFVDTYTVRDDGVATAAVATVTDAAVDGSYTGAVAFAAGSNVSIRFTTTGATSANDVVVTLVFQPME